MRRTLPLLLIALLAGCTSVSAAAPAAPPAVTPSSTPTVVTLGDSVPAGTACACEPFPDLYAQAQHAVSRNLAVAGATSADVLSRVQSAPPDLDDADEVILMIGANDVAAAFDNDTSYDDAASTVRTNVISAITAIEHAHQVPVVVLGYWNVVRDGQVGIAQYGADGMKAAVSATASANDALEDAARSTGATYVPTRVAFHGADEKTDATALLAADGDHPNALGHAKIAALLPPLTPSR